MYKTTKTKTTTGEYKVYRKLYVYHGKKAKKQWCYLKKEDLEKIEQATGQNYTNTTQITTQTSVRAKKPVPSFFQKNKLDSGSRGWELNPYRAALQAAA